MIAMTTRSSTRVNAKGRLERQELGLELKLESAQKTCLLSLILNLRTPPPPAHLDCLLYFNTQLYQPKIFVFHICLP
jgi:hypothetical protein